MESVQFVYPHVLFFYILKTNWSAKGLCPGPKLMQTYLVVLTDFDVAGIAVSFLSRNGTRDAINTLFWSG